MTSSFIRRDLSVFSILVSARKIIVEITISWFVLMSNAREYKVSHRHFHSQMEKNAHRADIAFRRPLRDDKGARYLRNPARIVRTSWFAGGATALEACRRGSKGQHAIFHAAYHRERRRGSGGEQEARRQRKAGRYQTQHTVLSVED